jgi:hypothetical protein
MSNRYRRLVQNQAKVSVLTLAQVKVNIWLAAVAAAIATALFFFSFWENLGWRALVGG